MHRRGRRSARVQEQHLVQVAMAASQGRGLKEKVGDSPQPKTMRKRVYQADEGNGRSNGWNGGRRIYYLRKKKPRTSYDSSPYSLSKMDMDEDDTIEDVQDEDEDEDENEEEGEENDQEEEDDFEDPEEVEIEIDEGEEEGEDEEGEGEGEGEEDGNGEGEIEDDDDTAVRRSERLRSKCTNYTYRPKYSAPKPQPSTRKRRINRSITFRKRGRPRTYIIEDHQPEPSEWSDEGNFEEQEQKRLQKLMDAIQPINTKPHGETHSSNSAKADIDPLILDTQTTFEEIGGLASHIKSLKEMILLPLLYPEVFSKFHIKPPRGVIFHGPPGTGKTLMARALANSCSVGNQQISFFMRKGADCLSKWVGEAERQLRLLFEKAKQLQPSIIFFDEIDGLAPVRSSKQEQIHSSIVSTLLALLDGLDDRGQVVVIGATNRIDAIDPALRRPGRFDREFSFSLPSLEGRLEILKIHTKKWAPAPSDDLLKYLATATVGYCGADLKHLCSESALCSLQKHYPEIYETNDKLDLNLDEVIVQFEDFEKAMRTIIPTSRRSSTSYGQPLNPILVPVLSKHVTSIHQKMLMMMKNVYQFNRDVMLQLRSQQPQADLSIGICDPRYLRGFIIDGEKDQGQYEVASAVIHAFDSIPVFCIDLISLHKSSTFISAEHTLVSFIEESLKVTPSLLFIPNIDELWKNSTKWMQSILSNAIERSSGVPQFILATCEAPYSELPPILQNRLLFQFHTMQAPSQDDRRLLFDSLLSDVLKPPIVPVQSQPRRKEKLRKLEIPQIRSDCDPQIEKEETDDEEDVLRILRFKLRSVVEEVSKEKKFSIFLKPVSQLLDIGPSTNASADSDPIDQRKAVLKNSEPPLCLFALLDNIDSEKYRTVTDFKNDVRAMADGIKAFYEICADHGFQEVITDSKGNPLRLPGRAVALKDRILMLLHRSISKGFDQQCTKLASRLPKPVSRDERVKPKNDHPVTKSARLRGENPEFDTDLLDAIIVSKRQNSFRRSLAEGRDSTPIPSSPPLEPRQISPYVFSFSKSSNGLSLTPTPTTPKVDSALSSSDSGLEPTVRTVEVDLGRLRRLVNTIINEMRHLSLRALIDLHSRLYYLFHFHSPNFDRNPLLHEMERVVAAQRLFSHSDLDRSDQLVEASVEEADDFIFSTQH